MHHGKLRVVSVSAVSKQSISHQDPSSICKSFNKKVTHRRTRSVVDLCQGIMPEESLGTALLCKVHSFDFAPNLLFRLKQKVSKRVSECVCMCLG